MINILCISHNLSRNQHTRLHGEDDKDTGHDPGAVVVLELEAQLHGEVVRVQGV